MTASPAFVNHSANDTIWNAATMSEAIKKQTAERAKEDAEAANWPTTYQRVNEHTGWRGEVFEFRRGSTMANAFEDGFVPTGTHAVEFTMPDGSKKIVRPAEEVN